MAGIMGMLRDIMENKPYYSFVDAARRQKAKAAFDKGLDCILKCQINDNGKLTVWCQQHDENTLAPAKARAYEPASIGNRESTGVVLFLMSIDNPSSEVINSIESAIKWFEDSKITGIRIEEFDTPPFETPLRTLTKDKRVVSDPNAPPIWTRFYELGTHRPLFSNRKSELLYSLADVDRERRAYGWYTYEPQKALDAYPTWKKKITTSWAISNDDIIHLCIVALDDFVSGMEWLKEQPLILAKRTKDGFILPDSKIIEHFQKKELNIISYNESDLKSSKNAHMGPRILKTGERAFIIYHEEPIFVSPEQIEIKVGYYGGSLAGGGTGKLFQKENGIWILKDRSYGRSWKS